MRTFEEVEAGEIFRDMPGTLLKKINDEEVIVLGGPDRGCRRVLGPKAIIREA